MVDMTSMTSMTAQRHLGAAATLGVRPMSTTMRVLTTAAALGCGAMGGVFFAFSTFVMDGLRRLPAPKGAAAMQAINVAAPRPPFMLLMFGTAALCVALAVRGGLSWGDRSAALLVAGAALYLVGTVGLTIGYHVPHNDALARLDPDAPGTASAWADYATSWVRWNHVRAATSLGAGLAFVGALLGRA
jgi:uncharacterized membrane protein